MDLGRIMLGYRPVALDLECDLMRSIHVSIEDSNIICLMVENFIHTSH